jgi:hypothetical protein
MGEKAPKVPNQKKRGAQKTCTHSVVQSSDGRGHPVSTSFHTLLHLDNASSPSSRHSLSSATCVRAEHHLHHKRFHFTTQCMHSVLLHYFLKFSKNSENNTKRVNFLAHNKTRQSVCFQIVTHFQCSLGH